MYEDRRRYQRLPIPTDTIAVDEAGHTLGRVTLAGGGGIQLEQLTADGQRELQQGRRLRVTVVEPAIGASHSAEVEVVYLNGSRAGLQFVGGKSAGA